MDKHYRLRYYDFKLILLLLLISGIGVMVVGSANATYPSKQLVGIAIGLTMMIVVSLIDYHLILKFYWLYYILAVALLVAVLFFGETVNGAKRWINIPHVVQFQPSEFAKILLILFYAAFIMKYEENLNTFRMLIGMVILMAVPVALVFKEPNLSTTILYCILFFVILYIGGVNYRIVFAFMAIMIPLVAIALYMVLQPDQTLIEGYQLTRILAFLNPDKYADKEAYQQLNSVIAIGSGQLWGKGLNNSAITSVKNGNFISEPETDFIFAIIGEELGFVGSVVIIVLLMLIAAECLMIAGRAQDKGGELIAAGVACVVGFQTFINVAVATMVMPNTGIPLPFVSYGTTSMVSLYIGMGLVLNVCLQRRTSY